MTKYRVTIYHDDGHYLSEITVDTENHINMYSMEDVDKYVYKYIIFKDEPKYAIICRK